MNPSENREPEIENFSPGIAVEISRIEAELSKLWEDSGDAKVRASLINLAIYTESAAAVGPNTELIAKIATEHACRALLIFANRAAETDSARAWISAHCHLAGKGGGQICSEQITFQLDGTLSDSLPNVVFSHVDSDLPLCFWCQAPFSEPIDAQLWRWVDRLIYDSRTWDDPSTQLTLVQQIGDLAEARTILCDLNWTRLISLRFALASIFDHANALRSLREITRVEISHAPGSRSSGLLLLGWLAAQLDWQLDSVLSRHAFRSPDQREVTFELTETAGPCISSLSLEAPGTTIRITREPEAEFFHGEIRCEGTDPASLRLPAGRESIHDTLRMELGRGGVHPLYHKALKVISPLFTA
ncbi:MAG: glucose-6-phosphate dehydrogenase assembly protein OpcA [Chthoniobacterales bacterium]